MDNDVILLIKAALLEVTMLINKAYEQSPIISKDHPLAQSGLRDGHIIILDYLKNNEVGIAFGHLLYMIFEPPLIVSQSCLQYIATAGAALGYSPETWHGIQTQGGKP